MTPAGSGDLRPADRAAILNALREGAEKSIASVTKHTRRCWWPHVSQPEPMPETEAWLDEIRMTYRRFSALQGELTQHCKVVQRR